MNVYLGSAVALAQVGDTETHTARFPSTFPIARKLSALDSFVGAFGPRRLHVSLGAAIAPAFEFPVPDNVKRWQERLAVAQGIAASRFGMTPESCTCDYDAEHPGLASVIAVNLIDEIKHWATEKNLKLSSLAPLWSRATHCSLVLRRRIRGVVVHEPDTVTLICRNTDGTTAGVTFPESGDVHTQQAQSWLRERNLDGVNTRQLVFTLKADQASRALPTQFNRYWRAV